MLIKCFNSINNMLKIGKLTLNIGSDRFFINDTLIVTFQQCRNPHRHKKIIYELKAT